MLNKYCMRILFMTFVICCSACGGGGSGDGAGSVDGSEDNSGKAYKGNCDDAHVSQGNAAVIAMDCYAGSSLAVIVGEATKSSTESGAVAIHRSRAILPMSQVLKLAIREMKNDVSVVSPPTKAIVKEEFEIEGTSGGSANYSTEVDDTTGHFTGTVAFNGYARNGFMFDGRAEIRGTLVLGGDTFTDYAIAFRGLSVDVNGMSYSMTGDLLWDFNTGAGVESLCMDLTVQEVETGNSYWYRDYRIVTEYDIDVVRQSMTGGYYHHDEGHVDVKTISDLVMPYGSAQPSIGTLMACGADGTWVKLVFASNQYVIEADTDGDGSSDWERQFEIENPPYQNTTPVANAGPDQTVVEGARVLLDGRGSADADNDTLSYDWEVVSSPDGYHTSLTNSRTSTPSFVAKSCGTYEIGLRVYDGMNQSEKDTATVVVTPIQALNPDAVTTKWEKKSLGSFVGREGAHLIDLDGGDSIGMAASASSRYWYVLQSDGEGGYNQVWSSPYYEEKLVRLLSGDINKDGHPDVLAVLQGGGVIAYDGETLQAFLTHHTHTGIKDAAVGDLDGDGSLDIVTTDGIKVSAYNAETGELKWSVSEGGGDKLVLGNVDGDRAMEVVTTKSRYKGYVLDGTTGAVKWLYADSFGGVVRLQDLDGDSICEIVGLSGGRKVAVFNGISKSPVWESQDRLLVYSFAFDDTNGDGKPEIVCMCDGGNVIAIDPVSRQVVWRVRPGSLSSAICVALLDVDGDGEKELIGRNSSSQGPDFFVANFSTGKLEWSSLNIKGAYALDIDGDNGIAMLSEEGGGSYYKRGAVRVLNGISHEVTSNVSLPSSHTLANKRLVRLGDMNGDGHPETVVMTRHNSKECLLAYNGVSKHFIEMPASLGVDKIKAYCISDVDCDGDTEVIAGVEIRGDNCLMVYDPKTGNEEWRSISMSGSIYALLVSDLSGDGHPEIAVLTSGRRVYVYDGVTHVLRALLETSGRSLCAGDIDNDGVTELLVGVQDKGVDIYDGRSLTVEKHLSGFNSKRVDALRVVDLDGTGEKELVLVGSGYLSIISGENLLWQKAIFDPNLGKNNHLGVKDLDGNGRMDFVIGSDYGMYHFEFTDQ